MPKRKSIKLSTPREVRRAITRVANMVLNNELEPKQANCILYACNVVLGAIRTDEQERKIDELERLMAARLDNGYEDDGFIEALRGDT